jgi:phosphate:Na+ symporter
MTGVQGERRSSSLLRVVADLEDMTDECVGMAMILERSVRKSLYFKHKEVDALTPFIGVAKEFLAFVSEKLGGQFTRDEAARSEAFEKQIVGYRNKLRKMGRKRMEAGEDVKTELLFIDLVKRIEHIGDYCYGISESLAVIGGKAS